MNFRKAIVPSLLAAAFLAPAAHAQTRYRHSHTATLLPDGNILLVGGRENVNTVTDSVQMYNMASNSYATWAGGLDFARSSHTATLMSDGRVLVAGGFNSSGSPMQNMEVCDPTSTSCSSIGNMASARGGHTATLLSSGPYAGGVILCGGQSGSATTITNACEIYVPGTGLVAGPSMTSSRMGHTASLIRGGRIFVSGGVAYSSGWLYEPTNEMYDPAQNKWTPVSALLQGRVSHTATVLNNGLIMIAGGYNSINGRYCQGSAESLDDDCWHITYDPGNTQDTGTHGIIDGAEFYDQNGARVVLREEEYGEMPYRSMGHSAVLQTDGKWTMHGGYGNIFPAFFTASPEIDSNSVIYLSTTGLNTATVNPNSVISFPLTFELSRPVSGRLTNADVFLSPPENPADPEFTAGDAEFYMGASTARLDGLAVGRLLGEDYDPGDFDSTVRLYSPSGTVQFPPITATSGDSIVSANLTMNPDVLPPTVSGRNFTGTITANVGFDLPIVYQGRIMGEASIQSGSFSDDDYIATLQQGGSGTFNIAAPTSCNASEGTCRFEAQIAFTGLNGEITNLNELTSYVTFYNPLGTAMMGGDEISLELNIDFAATMMQILDTKPTFAMTRSTAVIRGMVFSSNLTYLPKVNKWADLTDDKESSTLALPSFDHTAVYTPANDTVIFGGRNCEFNTASDCLRGVLRFSTATSAANIMRAVYYSGDSDEWPQGPALGGKRAFHTSTLLADGSILTCGGSDGASPLATCELMDPVTKAWAPTGSMNMPRSNHTATLLPNGNVLAAGGVAPYGVAISSAEIYYPETRRWVPTASMATARQLHTATLLPDGNVLVAGGATADAYSDSTEIFISSSNHWIASGSMINGRSQHTATLLQTGNVLMAGGVNANGAMAQAEIFNYQTRAFAAAAPMNYATYAHTANLLRNGSVLVVGGSNGTDSRRRTELFSGGAWTIPLDPDGASVNLNWNRANHRSVLLPDGRVMVTGGEMRGTTQASPESFDPDFWAWTDQGLIGGKTHHTTVLTRDNFILNIGGWDGGRFLDTVDMVHLSLTGPAAYDAYGFEAQLARQPQVSTGTVLFNQAGRVTLLSGTTNFHGMSEASGGGAGAANVSHHNPRLYMQQIDNQSGFVIDLSTRIYSAYSGPNTNWSATLSSITVITPSSPGAMPHGWYNMRVAASGVFSDGHTVQVTVPRPTGAPSVASGTVLGTSSITWTWDRGSIPLGGADGFSVYSATDNVFIATVAFATDVTYTQTGMIPNTAASIKVTAYNLGGSGAFSTSATYYTLAEVPSQLTITAASFETATLEWSGSRNSEGTPYELSISPSRTPEFSDPVAISTPVPFSLNHTSTSTVVESLSANQLYDFRVRAVNGAGITTGFSNYASTITVSKVTNFTGQALSSSEINWSWDEATGASHYEVYDITDGTAAVVLIGTTTATDITQSGLSPNRMYAAMARAVKVTGSGPVYGPYTSPAGVYTHTVQPLPGVPNVFSNVSTGTLTVNWITNGNSTWTVYAVAVSLSANFEAVYTTTVSVEGNKLELANLPPNTEYFVNIYPVNGNGLQGDVLVLGSTYTLAQVPVTLEATEITMSGIRLAWDPGSNPATTLYELRSSTSSLFAAPVTTHISFSDLYTSTTAFVSGLLTSTSYYFDVAALNGENIATARKRAVAAFTLPGPDGAPTGSVGGTSDPTADSVITGTLPDGTVVTLYIPAAAFPGSTAIAISTSATNACGTDTINGRTVEVAIFSQGNAQPLTPVRLTLSYSGPVPANASRFVLARYNPASGQCLPLDTTVGFNTIEATLNHFSVFQLMLRTAATNLNNVLVYPNPFYPNRGQGYVTINNIPAAASVRVYTLSGEKVWSGTAKSTGMIIWDGKSKAGNLVASGIYLAVIESSAGKKVLKLAVER